MKFILRVPTDWKEQWGSVIHAVKRNPHFMKHYLEYRIRHEREYVEPEESHYEPLLLMNNIILRAAFPTTCNQDPIPTSLSLTQLIHIVDDGSSGCVLNDGGSSPHLIKEHSLSKSTQFPDSMREPPKEAISSSTPQHTRKRKRDSDTGPERKQRRLGVTSAPGRVDLEVDTEPHFPTRPKSRHKQPPEVGQRLMELLSLRPHVTVGLVDHHRIQLYHADHSVVLVSSVADLSLHDDEGSIDRLIAILIAFRRLFLSDQRVLHHGQNGIALRLQGNGKVKGPIEIELETVISRAHSLVGRSTGVIHGTSTKWPNAQLVIKISWVDDFRISEREFMDKAIEEAEKPGHGWALNHLPRFFYAEDVEDPRYRSVQKRTLHEWGVYLRATPDENLGPRALVFHQDAGEREGRRSGHT
ncbi:hypothetical protein BDM02DRAFT_2074741 [Thelephora ganbajun]|uniref:Uncharacterized protein n=1 Tax=Thelephora ganbajun TaxID=370292 RepID=A0ACB6ZGI4_THEGA|nr:hypothetical protein BDM02DRAFT_2074741 [Thelephora ganbajun]